MMEVSFKMTMNCILLINISNRFKCNFSLFKLLCLLLCILGRLTLFLIKFLTYQKKKISLFKFLFFFFFFSYNWWDIVEGSGY
jgi:hypothetical protein